MSTPTGSQFTNLHKTATVAKSLQQKQAERRQTLLDEQKRDRAKCMDMGRTLRHESLPAIPMDDTANNNRPFERYIQLSEWFRDRPDNLANWLLVPCPKGMRCIVVARNGHTELYHKSGKFLRRFHSGLPGDAFNRMSCTILDCVYDKEQQKYHVLDTMCYADQELISCECIFRFVWIRSKLQENDMGQVTAKNEFAFVPIEYIDCEDDAEMKRCLSTYPMWLDNLPALDGLLFYHKDSSYVHGTTPLVGWLEPFLVPDVLGVDDEWIHPKYLADKPIDYSDYLVYMDKFDKQLAAKPRKRSGRQLGWRTKPDESEGRLRNADMELELGGRTTDDVHYGNESVDNKF